MAYTLDQFAADCRAALLTDAAPAVVMVDLAGPATSRRLPSKFTIKFARGALRQSRA